MPWIGAIGLYFGIWCISVTTGSDNQIIYTEGNDCNTVVELGAATVYSHHRPETTTTYSHDADCQVTFMAKKDKEKLMLKFEMLDIPDFLINGVCEDAIYIYDSNTVGSRPFRTAGSTNGLCGQDMPGVIVSAGPYITIFFRSNSGGTSGKGFKLQITAFSEADSADSCQGQVFFCQETRRCIEANLICDRVNHCPDGSDEDRDGISQCNPTSEGVWETIISFGVAGFVGIVIGGIVVIVLLIVCIVCTFRRCGKSAGDVDHRQSIPSSTHGSVGVGNTQTTKDGIAYHQVPQANHQVNPQMMHHALNHYAQDPAANGPPAYGMVGSLPPQPLATLSHQRPGYLNNQTPIEMQMQMGYMASNQPGQVIAGYNSYNSPFHQLRGESHSYSSGYSSQQGAAGGGFQPMHTKPIMPHRGYSPTSGSSRSSDSDTAYTKGDNQLAHKQHDRGRLPVAL